MRITMKDYFLFEANCYSIYVFLKPLTLHDFYLITEKFKYYCKKDGMSWLNVFSTTQSDTAKIVVKHTGKRGRPISIVKGVKLDGHMHSAVTGTKVKSAYKTANKIKSSINKTYKRKVCEVVSKGKTVHARIWVGYCLKQADIVRSGGSFDFKACSD